ncbi:MAG: hypothetical protein IPJ81_07800 [Chitinophagaceae bacterium]|nr:hypothetical protein [Chitinophagaceae bacterium]
MNRTKNGKPTHLLIGSVKDPMQNIMRDLKRHTSEELHKAIQKNNIESRKEWMLWMMERAGKKNSNNINFQLFRPRGVFIA